MVILKGRNSGLAGRFRRALDSGGKLRGKIVKKRYVFLLFLLMPVVLWSSGWGQRRNLGEEAGDTAEPQEAARKVQTAPLLEWEDAETENLAGLLQEVSGGMMVRLEAGQLTGSGVICAEEEGCLVIVTAAHVLADMSGGVRVTFVDGWETEEAEAGFSDLADLAALRIPLEEIPEEHLERYLVAVLDKSVWETVQGEDGCIVIGSKSGVAEEAYEGVVLDQWIYMEDYGQYMTWVRAPGQPGMSGGGLCDRRGRLLGVLSGRSEDGEWAVVPLALVMEMLGDL